MHGQQCEELSNRHTVESKLRCDGRRSSESEVRAVVCLSAV